MKPLKNDVRKATALIVQRATMASGSGTIGLLRGALVANCFLMFTGCAVSNNSLPNDPGDMAVAWVRASVEFEAAALQTYESAGQMLELLLVDRDWSALPGQTGASTLAPAVILDVDETVLDNSEYQQRHGSRYDPATWDDWLAQRAAGAVPGAVSFLERARALNVTAFFITNRPCRKRSGNADPCPQEHDTLTNLRALGINTDEDHLLLMAEQPGWGREKQPRRMEVAQQHRVIMLFGDQLGDFLACVRKRNEPPCAPSATVESRRDMSAQHAAYWAKGWFMLPNPMYGSWSGFEADLAP